MRKNGMESTKKFILFEDGTYITTHAQLYPTSSVTLFRLHAETFRFLIADSLSQWQMGLGWRTAVYRIFFCSLGLRRSTWTEQFCQGQKMAA
jgi:hypothetical protein